MMPYVTTEEWDARDQAWQARVAKLGVERAIYHSKHQAPEFPAVTAMQREAIWPHFTAALNGTERIALDFGCGYGRWTPMLAEAVGNAIGVDPTSALLAHAEERKPDGVTYARYQHGQIPAPDQAFDVIWACMVLSTVLTHGMFVATLHELRRVAKPGALVCLIDNTSLVDGRPVRSKYSISRTIEEYHAAFAPWVDLSVQGDYIDFGEINTVFTGRVHG
jgi:ubiquinone/menaquinone biosynthesis C-methylase UbiE